MLSQTKPRVLMLDESLRESIKKARAQADATTEQFIDTAVQAKLPALVAGLQQLGFSPKSAKTRPAKLPMTAAALSALRNASEMVDVPQVQLLAICLSLASNHNAKPAAPAAKKSRKKATTKKAAASKKRGAK